MIRILTLAAAATLLVAPASAQSIRIPTAGKTPEQLHADITKAAAKVCGQAVVGATFPREEFGACMRFTVASAVRQARDPALAAVAKIQLAQR